MRSYVTRALALISAVYLVGCDGGTTTDAAKSAEAPPPEEVAEVKTADSSTPAAVNTPAASPRRKKPPGQAKKEAAGPKDPAKPKAAPRAEGALPKDLPASPAWGTEGWETKGRWTVVGWANPGEVALTKEKGNSVLRLKGTGGGKYDKVAISSRARMSLAEKGKGTLWVYNPSRRSVKVAFAVFVHDDRVYYESPPAEVGRGWKKAQWDLATSDYKCESSEWQYKASVWKRDDVRELVLIVYEPGKFEIALDAAAFDLAPPKPKPEPAPDKPDEGEDDTPGQKVEASAVLTAAEAKALKVRLSDADKAKIRATLGELEGE